MNNRRKLVIALGASALAVPLSSFAQQQGGIPRIGFLASIDPPAQLFEEFREGLRERGYIEGKNISVVYRWAEKTYERLPELAAELVRMRVDLIVAWATPSAVAAKQATATIPIVFFGVSDPVQSGLIASLARPGGNVTGNSALARDLSAKLVQLLFEVVPKTKRLAIVFNPSNPSSSKQLKEAQAGAQLLSIELDIIEVRRSVDLAIAFSAMTKSHAMGAVIIPDPMILSEREQIAHLAIKSRMPTVFARRENVEAGGLISYGPNLSEMTRNAASYVDKILKGAKPRDLPVEQPTKFELVLNMKTAKALGLTIPQPFVMRADKVIE